MYGKGDNSNLSILLQLTMPMRIQGLEGGRKIKKSVLKESTGIDTERQCLWTIKW